MSKSKRKILLNAVAAEALEIGAAGDQAQSILHAQKLTLISNPCARCRKSTPTVSTVTANKCLFCGEDKTI